MSTEATPSIRSKAGDSVSSAMVWRLGRAVPFKAICITGIASTLMAITVGAEASSGR